MPTPPHIIILALLCLFSAIGIILKLIISKRHQLTKGIIIKKYKEPSQKVDNVILVDNIPVFYENTIPTTYYFDIEGYDRTNKLRITTIEVTKKTYDQYKIGDIWRTSNTD